MAWMYVIKQHEHKSIFLNGLKKLKYRFFMSFTLDSHNIKTKNQATSTQAIDTVQGLIYVASKCRPQKLISHSGNA